MARHSLACSCPSVCPRCKFQTVIHVYIPDEIHALGLPSSKNTRGMNTTLSYSAKLFDSPFGEICTTPSRTVTSTCRVFSWQLNLHESRGIQLDLTPPPRCSFTDEDSAGGYFWFSCLKHFLISVSLKIKQLNTWILSGMYTWRTVWHFKQGQTEGQEHASECLAMPNFQGTGKTSYEMMTIRINSSSEKSALPWTHETTSSYPPYCTVSLALEMVRIQTDFKHAHTKRLTPRCLYMSKTPSRWW